MNWITVRADRFFQHLSAAMGTPLFYIGDTHLSISAIVQLIILAIFSFFIARLLSEGIKRSLLVRMGLDRGSREAISTIISYILATLGCIFVLQSAGINLTSLTVLAGVVGIGFGFGLQNLASNFISGLTLLFEHQIRVGDFIEIDHLLGTVENISIRSTIIKTIDGLFVIIPNIKFVETNIINWSYRDPRCRLRIPVGVAYGTDPVLVTEALLVAARLEPNILSHPSPKVWFCGFGDNALDFQLLVWIDQPQESDAIKSAVNFLIDYEFRRRNIEIPFPQRDLWLRNPQEITKHFQDHRDDNSNGKVFPQNAKHSTEIQSNSTVSEQKKPGLKSPNNWTLRDLLRRVTYFDQCTDLELRQLIEYGYRQLFPAGQIVCKENAPGDSFYIILSGSVEVLSQKADKYIATLHEGEFFGEISLLLGTPRTATVKTSEDAILFVVERHDLQKLLIEQPNLADQIAQKLSERQQALRDLGLLDGDSLGQTPFIKIRKRIQVLFGI
ncbi:mechanosensitive ion channel [Lyngbya sp. CCAP 1446/10]|uniref:cyclic nucleotide-binding domain-containing protein n=1 Tax=Lyngbya sp. CCAP 1446/10 TaxID=439293 RepID=UPI002237E88A|nr:cyclic nucleotide-binding domain-containing protein [Lyngbya sp. CCAP 1446/10]MCW6052988.1 mechanosensitive ion channel [Lyngbya sp. CCAP 1446/10]